jgi:hypothetical protein
VRSLVLLVIAACGAPPSVGPLANVAAARAEPPSFDLAIHDPAWRLDGTGAIEKDAFTFSYCCKAAGSAKRALAEVTSVGRWELAIEHSNSECSSAVHVLLFAADNKMPIARGLLDAEAKTTGTSRLAFWAPDMPLELRLYAEGGLHCCGTTEVDSVMLRRLP